MPSCLIHAVTTNINVTPVRSFEMAETGMSLSVAPGLTHEFLRQDPLYMIV